MSERDELDKSLMAVPCASMDAFVAQAELFLAGTVQLGTAADAKATTLTGAFAAIDAGLAAVAATMLASPDAARLYKVIVACTGAAAIVFAAVVCFAISAQPCDFHTGGYEPKLLAGSATDRTQMLRWVAGSLQQRIDLNRQSLERSSSWTRFGIGLVLLACLIAVLLYFAA